MEQVAVISRSAAHERFRVALMSTVEFVENLPAMRPRWVALDVAILVLLVFH